MMVKTLSKNMTDIFIAFACIAVGIWFFYESNNLPSASNPSDLGPGAFPLLVSVLLIICGILMIISNVKNRKDTERVSFYRIKNTIMFAILLSGYLLLMNLIGYYITTVIMVPLLLLAAGIKNIKVILLILVILLLVAFVGFDMLLGVPLP